MKHNGRALRVLWVDGDPRGRDAARGWLEGHCACQLAESLAEAQDCLSRGEYNLVAAASRLPDGRGAYLLEKLEAEGHPAFRLLVAPAGSRETEPPGQERPSYDFRLAKPLDAIQLGQVLDLVAIQVELGQSNHALIERTEWLGKELEGLRSLFRSLFQAVPGAWLLLDRQGRVLMANSQAELLCGSQSNGLVGRLLAALLELPWGEAAFPSSWHGTVRLASARSHSFGLRLKPVPGSDPPCLLASLEDQGYA